MKQVQQVLENFAFWPSLSQTEKETLLYHATFQSYTAGQLIRGGDRDCLGLFCVTKGILRAYLLSPDGKEVILYRLRESDCCVLSASCVLDAVSFETFVRAEEDCALLLIPIDIFSALMSSNIYVEKAIYQLAIERFSDVVAGVERIAFLNIEQRIVAFLLDEAAAQNTDTLYMTHEQIAINIASAREVVSRTLRYLNKQALVSSFRGGITLQDKPALYEMLAGSM